MTTIVFEETSCEDLISFFPIASRDALLLKMDTPRERLEHIRFFSDRDEYLPIKVAQRNSDLIYLEPINFGNPLNRFSVPDYVRENFLEIKGFKGWELWNTNPISPYPCPWEMEDLLSLDDTGGVIDLWMSEAQTLLTI